MNLMLPSLLPSPLPLAGADLDRADNLRHDPAWIDRLLGQPTTRVALLRQAQILMTEDAAGPEAVWLPATTGWLTRLALPLVLLGLDEAGAWFAADLTALDEADAELLTGPLGRFEELRTVAGLMPARAAARLAYARGMMEWHARHRFCGICGSPTEVRAAGHRRKCTNPACAADHFPRSDPAVIVMVHDGADHCLLGRSPRFPEGMYSTLAGFVEPGESLEECVIREVGEEAGIRVRDVSYRGSQPWPFPSSLMLGFFAIAERTPPQVDNDELEDARWVSRAELNSPNPPVKVPPGLSIARALIDSWLAG